MAINKVVLGERTLIDLSLDTATEADVAKGKYFHRADGELVEGTLEDTGGSGGGGSGGGGGGGVVENDVNFYDYDGTLLYSYSLIGAKALTELPALPEREGLTYQEWNWTLEEIKAYNRPVDVGATCVSSDGATRLYISLREGRTSPILRMGVKGTVTVDWGDGTTPDTLTGTSVSTKVSTPAHNYANAGDYVIKLTIDGEARFLSQSNGCGVLLHSTSQDGRNACYASSIQKVIIGDGIKYFGDGFWKCGLLKYINIPNTVTGFASHALDGCYSLRFAAIPRSAPAISSDLFYDCDSLRRVSLNGNLGGSLYQSFRGSGLQRVVLPDTIKNIGDYAFMNLLSLEKVVLPKNLVKFGASSFGSCRNLLSIELPQGLTILHGFDLCESLTSVVVPSSVTTINAGAFRACQGLRFVDFSNHTAIPTLSSSNIFDSTPADMEIRVPAALYDEWIAATNWSSVASKIVAV